MTWQIGQRVLCVASKWAVFHPAQITGGTPVGGCIYTIRGFNTKSADNDIAGTLGFWLEEIVNPKLHHTGGDYREMSFDEGGFRPVRDTDISVFTAMLDQVTA